MFTQRYSTSILLVTFLLLFTTFKECDSHGDSSGGSSGSGSNHHHGHDHGHDDSGSSSESHTHHGHEHVSICYNKSVLFRFVTPFTFTVTGFDLLKEFE